MALKYVTRTQWGARAYREGGNAFTPPIVGCTIHWEGPGVGTRTHDRCDDLVRQIQAFHMDSKGWTDIAYNLAVCEHGYVYEGRGRDRGNGANGDSSNRTRYSICALVGDGDPQPATLLDGIRDAVTLCQSWGAGASVDGHRDHIATGCPGDALYAAVKAGRFAPAPKPTPKPVPAPAPTPITTAKEPSMVLIKSKDKPEVYVSDGITRRHVASLDHLADLQAAIRAEGGKGVVTVVKSLDAFGKVVA